MNAKLEIGTPVRIVAGMFESHVGRDDLVVLYTDNDEGYGVGPKDYSRYFAHDPDKGWLWYFPDEVEAK